MSLLDQQVSTEAAPAVGGELMSAASAKPARRPRGQRVDPNLSPMERWARDPNIDVAKLERLYDLMDRERRSVAETAFNAAMSAAQAGIRPAVADDWNDQTRSAFASYEALDKVARPVYTAHGFGVSFDTAESPFELHVRLVCYATHSGGHAKTYHIDMPADGKGAKGGDVMTRTHATGSAVTYGMRYLLKMVFNIPIKDKGDDDGNGATAPTKPFPEGFANWFAAIEKIAAQGSDALEAAWQATNSGVFKSYVRDHYAAQFQAIKARAAAVRS
jgi:hypothetical protein